MTPPLRADRTKAPPPPPPPPPNAPVDVATITTAQARALPPAYQTAVREAQAYATKHFAGMAPAPRVLVTPAKSNGDAPVTVIVPPGAKAPLTVQTHYHGDRAGAVSGENAAADQIAAKVKKGGSTVYVLPEAQKTGTPTNWRNVGDINATTTEALAAAGLGSAQVGRTVVSAHSAGGRAIARDLDAGHKLKADELVLQDALYEGKAEPAYSPILAKLPGSAVKSVTLVHSDDEGMQPRGEKLAGKLREKGIDVTFLGVKHHPQAAGVLEAPPTVPLHHEDRFERRPARP